MIQDAKKILIVGPAWVGDMVMAQVLFKLLKQQNPNVVIDVLAPNWSRPLLERMPEVNAAISLPIGHGKLELSKRYQIAKSLRPTQYDTAILMPNSWKSALIPFWAKIPKRIGWLGEGRWGLLNDVRYLKKDKLPLMIQRFAALGLTADATLPKDLPSPHLHTSPENIQQALTKFNLQADVQADVLVEGWRRQAGPPSRAGTSTTGCLRRQDPEASILAPILALCPGAEFGAAKRWPAEYYAEVAKTMLQQGWQVWLFGSPNDKPVAEVIQQMTDHQCQDLVGNTQLAEAIDLLSLANLVVCNDSGLMHIAAALQRPIIAVYGSTSPRFTPPLTEQLKVLNLNLACSPCFKRECPLQHLNCLNNLKPELVLNAMKELAIA